MASMPAVAVRNVVKSYGDRVAVDGLSFTAEGGEILGLIGPNGAGKTTTIRMVMDITKPDSGDIRIFGRRLDEALKDRLGYLPEERGLYKKMSVIDSILYFALLKGMRKGDAEQRADALLQRTGMWAHRSKKTDQLSKGMAQLVQFIVAIVHDPELVILDEAFAGLDPVNTELLKELVVELRKAGKVVLLSTHQMNQVEEMCDRVLMVDHGRAVLYGGLEETRARFRGNSVFVGFEGELGPVQGVVSRRDHRGFSELELDADTTPAQVLERLIAGGIAINRFEVATPSLNDIFLKVAGASHE